MTSSNRSVNKDIGWRSTEQSIWCHVAWNKLWGAWKVQSHRREGRWDRGSDASCFSPEIFSTWNIFTWYIFPPGIFFALNFVETFFSGSLRIGGQLCFFQKDKCNISVFWLDPQQRWNLQSKRRKGGKGGPAPPFWILNASDSLQWGWLLPAVCCMLTMSSEKGFPCQLKRGSKVVAQSRH